MLIASHKQNIMVPQNTQGEHIKPLAIVDISSYPAAVRILRLTLLSAIACLFHELIPQIVNYIFPDQRTKTNEQMFVLLSINRSEKIEPCYY